MDHALSTVLAHSLSLFPAYFEKLKLGFGFAFGCPVPGFLKRVDLIIDVCFRAKDVLTVKESFLPSRAPNEERFLGP